MCPLWPELGLAQNVPTTGPGRRMHHALPDRALRCLLCSTTRSRSMASLPHLEPGEIALLDLATDDTRDVVSLSEKEAWILQLYNQAQEQELEKAILEQGTRAGKYRIPLASVFISI